MKIQFPDSQQLIHRIKIVINPKKNSVLHSCDYQNEIFFSKHDRKLIIIHFGFLKILILF